MDASTDDVSRLQGRYSLTLLSPSSKFFSLALSTGMTALLAAVVLYLYLQDAQYWRIGTVVAVLLATQWIDAMYIRNQEYSKSLHSSAFGSCIWMIALLTGLVSASITDSAPMLFFVALGMFLLASFRISIYTTVLGCGIGRAWAVAFVQPLALFGVMIPADMWWDILADPLLLGYGAAYLACATAWSLLTDRSGRPDIKSTHVLVQAYISSQGGRQHEIEGILETRSGQSGVSTTLIRFGGDQFCMALPGVHPGPYHPVGGSNIPYLMYEKLGRRAMILHSISDHALNIPSRRQVERYLSSLNKVQVQASGGTCTEPVIKICGRSRVTGICLGRNALLFLSLSPYGMEDLPSSIKAAADSCAADLKLRALLVDCHNAMGPEISGEDHADMEQAIRECLQELSPAPQYNMRAGYANSGQETRAGDLAHGGLAVACIEVKDSKYYIGWADANNMENGIREAVSAEFTKDGRTLLEICTSDTHYNPIKPKNRNGYYPFGHLTDATEIVRLYRDLARSAEETVSDSSYEIAQSDTDLLLMGQRIFEYFSRAMDHSMKLVKVFMSGSAALFLSTLLVLL